MTASFNSGVDLFDTPVEHLEIPIGKRLGRVCQGGQDVLALGRPGAGRMRTIVFTVRGTRIRVISARAMSKAERTVYGQAQADPEGTS